MITLEEFVVYMTTKGYSEREAMKLYRDCRGHVTRILCWFEVENLRSMTGILA